MIMTKKLTPDSLIDKLGQMNPDDIAQYLKRRGFKGFRGNNRRCPLARAIADLDGEVRVYPATAYVEDNGRERPIDLPVSLQTFIENFDFGRYPDLVSPDEDPDTSW